MDFSSLWWPFGWNWSYLGFLGIIWRTCGGKCRGESGGIFPTLCVECCLVTYNIVYCVCDEEFDSFCCRFTTMSPVMARVMESGGCRIASPAWQMKSLGTRRQYSQATVNNVLPLITDNPTFLTRPPNIAHSAWMHGTLWNAIFTSLIASEIDVIDTLRFNNDVDYLYRLATVLEMRLNHEYWCEPECTWQTNSINKTTTSERLACWASRLWRGIELVFKSLDLCDQFFQPDRLLEWGVFQRSKVKVTEVTTQLSRFRTVTPVWIHI